MRRLMTTLFIVFAASIAAIGQPNPDKPPRSDFNVKVKVKDVAGREVEYGTGWKKDSVAVKQFLSRLERNKKQSTFEKAAPRLLQKYGDDAAPVFFWHSERKVLGSVQKSWNQGQVGSCVGFGYGRATQDVMLNEVAAGQAERYPGTDVSPEVIYGGSRVEVGGGGINGDGSIGAWAADWVKNWGVVVRGKYGALDLTSYNEGTCRRLGDQGIPADVEAIAKLHPVTEVALVTTTEGLWAALGSGKAVPVCSMQGWTTTRDADGYCRRSGEWAHCMTYRGRFVHPTRGKSVVIQNSWGDYLGSSNAKFKYKDVDGSTKEETLPEGCFCVELTTTAEALRDRDTFVLAGLTGWEAPSPPTPPPGPNPVPPHPTPSKPIVVTVDGVTVTLDFSAKKVTLPEGWTTNLTPITPEKSLEEVLISKGLNPSQTDAVLRIVDVFLGKTLPPKAMASNPQPISDRLSEFSRNSILRPPLKIGADRTKLFPNLSQPVRRINRQDRERGKNAR